MRGNIRGQAWRLAFALGLTAPLLGAAVPFRVSVAATVGTACGQSVTQEGLQDLAKTRLDGDGIALSSVHDATLAIDTDCTAVRESGRRSMVVHECLTLSELVNPAANDGRATLAATWQKCESFPCDREKCEAAAPYESALFDDFLNYFQERTAEAARAAEAAAAARAQVPDGPSMQARVIFFAAYTMCCLTVLLYWQFRKQSPYRS